MRGNFNFNFNFNRVVGYRLITKIDLKPQQNTRHNKSPQQQQFNMASFMKFREGMDMVYDYAVLVDFNTYNACQTEYVFHQLYNETETYMTIDGEKYDEIHNNLLVEAKKNAMNGIMTFAKIGLSSCDSWVYELYTEEQIKTKITEEQYLILKNVFDEYLKSNIEKKRKYDIITKELAKLKENDYSSISFKIGEWEHKEILYNNYAGKYITMMEADALQHKVHFPIEKFISNL
jgi:hypothetical protein